MAESRDDRDRDETRSKVGRVIQKYDLGELGAELERRWLADDDERLSLRDLADLLNRRVLQAALVAAGRTSTDRDVAHLYETLQGDVSAGERIRKERELERDGVDVEALTSDFVTHQAVHTYLKKYRNAEYDREPQDPTKRSVETLQRLRSRTTAVTDRTVAQLAKKDEITAQEYETFVEMRIRCAECGSEYDAVAFIERGGCDCD
ncbi:rod-determining factor RdfA [Haloplanus pelagicus]|jgi:hypothetical protein|uniref:rod-determining factor RdfA n=1 Tax=Haloplanus pelagicus TaxID=2949995 RepID=UPI00203EC998|nr:rod-determining factor RdfA [Haloplanus sp. HW8-1]